MSESEWEGIGTSTYSRREGNIGATDHLNDVVFRRCSCQVELAIRMSELSESCSGLVDAKKVHMNRGGCEDSRCILAFL